MKVEIDINCGSGKDDSVVYKQDIQENIDALERAIEGKLLCSDFVRLLGAKSLLEGIQEKLPSWEFKINFEEVE